jgi:hypothetical protein
MAWEDPEIRSEDEGSKLQNGDSRRMEKQEIKIDNRIYNNDLNCNRRNRKIKKTVFWAKKRLGHLVYWTLLG